MQQDRESGQSIIIIAASVVILLALVALVVDIGNAYAHRRMVQNACDAAALAGARKLADRALGEPVLEILVLNEIETYAEKNGLDRNVVQAWFIDRNGERLETVDPWLGPAPGDAEGVEVAGDLPFTTYFAHMLGFAEMTASTTAKAWVLSGPCTAGGLFPVTVSTDTFTKTNGTPEIGPIYTIWDHDKPNAPGNWGFLYWEDGDGENRCPDGCPQGPQVSVLGPNIQDNSRSGGWSVDDWVHGDPGTNMNPLLDEMAPYV
ncbi:MAG TPA: pilus assembly protein TadG-related protein, partial [Anaerolineae bacterium]|nr:pilus assembly protein TadG-related protein [Anaerolineae bacterium]